jgi:hypothetical protein
MGLNNQGFDPVPAHWARHYRQIRRPPGSAPRHSDNLRYRETAADNKNATLHAEKRMMDYRVGGE